MSHSSWKTKMQDAGYSQEDAYFFNRNQELIKDIRSKKPHLKLIKGRGGNSEIPQLPIGKSARKAA